MRKTARILSLLMAAALTIAQTPVIAAAEEEQPIHECTAVTMTAVDEQSHAIICEDCGASVTEAHSFGDWNTQDAQCHVRVCTCGASVTEPHTWDDGVLEEAAGIRIYTCTVCSASYTETADPSEDEIAKTPTDEKTDSPADENAEASADGKTTQSSEALMIGDVDGDGQVTASDVMIVCDISRGNLSSATELQRRAADVNQDGRVNLADVVSLYKTLINGNERNTA